MFKRLAAFLFIFAFVGQVSAGVCGCLSGDSKSQHACCKPKKTTGDVISAKGCCDTECVVNHSEKLTQERIAPPAEIKSQTAKPLAIATIRFEPVVVPLTPSAEQFEGNRLKYSRPPDLYLRHHAFLI